MNKFTFAVSYPTGEDLQDRKHAAEQIVENAFGGFTASTGTGAWKHHQQEDTWIIEVYTQKPESVAITVAQQLRDLFRQQAVMLASEPANMEYV